MSDKFFEISCYVGGSDFKIFQAVVNKGIDSHLEAFTKSKFKTFDGRLFCDFARNELPILLRRLRELDNEEGERWAEDIESILADERHDEAGLL